MSNENKPQNVTENATDIPEINELEHNSFEQLLKKTGEYLKVNGNKILTGVIVIALAFSAWTYFNREANKANYAVIDDYGNVVYATLSTKQVDDKTITKLQDLAKQDSVDWVACDANLRLGWIFSNKALRQTEAAARDSHIEKARQYYNAVIKDYSDNKYALAIAYGALGSLDETQGKTDAALANYEKIKALPNLEGHYSYHYATMAIANLKETTKPVNLAAGKAKYQLEEEAEAAKKLALETQAATKPTTKPATEPASKPAGNSISAPKTPAPAPSK